MNYKGHLNYIFSFGTLTIKCFVHAERNEEGEAVKYHGTTHVATIRDVHKEDIDKVINAEIKSYLERCKFKNCERTFSWKFETL